MAVGIAELIILGLIVEWIARKMRLPGLIGLLFLGVIAGMTNLIDPAIQPVTEDLRLIALVVILLRAGFEISRETLAKVGVRALLLSCIPCIFEVGFITLTAPVFLDLSYMEAAMLGSVLGAVSPAVVVPLMVGFIKKGVGVKRGIPTLVLTGASCDDAVAIVLCSSFVGMYVGKTVSIGWNLASLPISVILGIAFGILLGFLLYYLFTFFNPRATKRVLITLGLSLMLLFLEKSVHEIVPFAALLSIMTIGFIILEKNEHMAHEISSKLGKIWVLAQILLFTIVGMQVDIGVALKAGAFGALVIVIGLIGRSLGVNLSLLKSSFSKKERAFVTISYVPKATVQAAIGALPLAAMKSAGMNTAPGELILAIAVLSIVFTAPLGALAITWAGRTLLEIEPDDSTAFDPSRTAARESE